MRPFLTDLARLKQDVLFVDAAPLPINAVDAEKLGPKNLRLSLLGGVILPALLKRRSTVANFGPGKRHGVALG